MPHVWALEKEESARAIELLDKAVAIDPEYALALSLTGWCTLSARFTTGRTTSRRVGGALKLAERAAELSGDDPLILAVLGAVHTFVRNHGTARVLLERAVAIDATRRGRGAGWGGSTTIPTGRNVRSRSSSALCA